MKAVVRYRGGVDIHTQGSRSFSSFGTWEVGQAEIVVRAAFKKLKISKSDILEIRCKRRLTPEFQIVYYVEAVRLIFILCPYSGRKRKF